MKKFYIISLCLLLCSCYSTSKFDHFAMPNAPKTGPQNYLQGWNDGCRTGMTSYSNSHLRTQYQTTVNAEKMRLPEYQKGWEVGQSYCSYYISSYLANTELVKNDARTQNNWFTLKSDGFFSYSGFDKLDSGFHEASDLPFLSGNRNSLVDDNGSFFN
jgi:hypothetical protein